MPRFHSTPIGCALSWKTGPFQLDLPRYLWYTVRNPSCPLSGRKHLPRLSPDLLAFLLIMYTALRSNLYQFQIPSLLRTVAQDATYYFLVIFTSHLLLELTLTLGRVKISSYLSAPSFLLTEILIAFDPTDSWRVSNTMIRLLRLFTRSPSMEQWKLRVCLNVSLLLKPSSLNFMLGTSQ